MDHEPLLEPGKHEMDLAGLKDLTVSQFSDGALRSEHFSQLKEFVAEVEASGLQCEVWVNGSFLSKKPEPGDIDLTVVFLEDPAIPDLPQRIGDVINQLKNSGFENLDWYITVRAQSNTSFYAELDKTQYWFDLWSKDRSNTPKGFAALPVRV